MSHKPGVRWHVWWMLGFLLVTLIALPLAWSVLPVNPKDGTSAEVVSSASATRVDAVVVAFSVSQAGTPGDLVGQGRLRNLGNEAVSGLSLSLSLDGRLVETPCGNSPQAPCWREQPGAPTGSGLALFALGAGESRSFEVLVASSDAASTETVLLSLCVPGKEALLCGDLQPKLAGMRSGFNWNRFWRGFWVVVAILGVPIAAAVGVLAAESLRHWNESARSIRSASDERRKVVLQAFTGDVLKCINQYVRLAAAIDEALLWMPFERALQRTPLMLYTFFSIQKARSSASAVFLHSFVAERRLDAAMEILSSALRDVFGYKEQDGERKNIDRLRYWADRTPDSFEQFSRLVNEATDKKATLGRGREGLAYLAECWAKVQSNDQTPRWVSLYVCLVLVRGVLLWESNCALSDWYGEDEMPSGASMVQWAVRKLKELDVEEGATQKVAREVLATWGFNGDQRRILEGLPAEIEKRRKRIQSFDGAFVSYEDDGWREAADNAFHTAVGGAGPTKPAERAATLSAAERDSTLRGGGARW